MNRNYIFINAILIGLFTILFIIESPSIGMYLYKVLILLLLINSLFFVVKKIDYHFMIGLLLISITFLYDIIDNFNNFDNYYIDNVIILLGTLFIFYGFIRLNQDLRKKAYYHSITKCPNKNYIKEILPSELNFKNDKIAFLYLDINDFKLINDNYGHHFGNMVLKKMSHRFKNIVGEQGTVFHLSSDEFLIVVHRYQVIKEINQLIKNIQKDKLFEINGVQFFLSVSIGIALAPKNGRDIDILIRHADIAMYHAKNSANRSSYYITEKIANEIKERFSITNSLNQALKNNEFVLHYQPKKCLQDDSIAGFEALIRWQHPQKGLLYPNKFIHIAEISGQITEIDKWVLKEACKEIKRSKHPINISINISPAMFRNRQFLLYLDELLEETKIDPKLLSIEITENTAMENTNSTIEILKQIKKRNIGIHIDDFGRRFSSLAYIKNFTFDVLKIDKLFIDGIGCHHEDEIILETMISLSKQLGKRVIAEGVETKEQEIFTRRVKCDEYQGYFYSKPKPMEAFFNFIEQTNKA